MIYSILIFITSVFISIYTGQAMLFFVPVSFYLFGQVLVFLLSDIKNKGTYSKLYSIAYMSFLIYATICFIYMREHNYPCLLVTDTITSYIPAVQDFMKLESLKDGWNLLYGSFSSQAYSHAGIILFYWAAAGKYGMLFGNELYYNLQVSVLFLSAFVPIFLYRLLSQNDVRNAFKYSLIYVLCSVFFYYSTLILRDAPIALIYLIAFSYVFSESSVKKHVIFISLAILSYAIRPQNGLFLLLFYFISTFSNTRSRTALILIVLVGTLISYVYVRLDIFEALERNLLYAELNIEQETQGFINMLDRLPPVISELAKTVYIQISPIPAWFYIGVHGINESNNIMTFPRPLGVIYNFIVLGGIIYGFLHYKKLNADLKQSLFIALGILYLLLQTSSTEQRRIMICYPILYLFALLVFQKMSPNQRRQVMQVCIVLFVLVQVFALSRGL